MTDDQGLNANGHHRWPVDRRIPVVWIFTIVAAIILQTLGLGYVAGQFNKRVEILEVRTDTQAAQIDRLTNAQSSSIIPLSEKVVTLGVKMDHIKENMARIEAYLQPVPVRRPAPLPVR